MDKISIVVPCFNEIEVIAETHTQLMRVMASLSYEWEVIYINDGSRDKTLDYLVSLASDQRVKVVSFTRNFGHQAAVCAGLKYVTGDFAAIIDAGLQDPPDLIEKMVEALREGGVDIVYGQREERTGESIFKKATAHLFYRLLNSISDVKFPVDTGDFRVVSRRTVDSFNALPERSKYIRGLISWLGYSQLPYNYKRDRRFAGETKYTFRKMVKLAIDGFVSFSVQPLRLAIGRACNIFCVNGKFHNGTLSP